MVTACHARLLRRLLRSLPVDVLLLEPQLSGGNWHDMILEVRRAVSCPRFIVVTRSPSAASALLALRAGAEDYLPKPLDWDRLLTTLLPNTRASPAPAALPCRPPAFATLHALEWST